MEKTSVFRLLVPRSLPPGLDAGDSAPASDVLELFFAGDGMLATHEESVSSPPRETFHPLMHISFRTAAQDAKGFMGFECQTWFRADGPEQTYRDILFMTSAYILEYPTSVSTILDLVSRKTLKWDGKLPLFPMPSPLCAFLSERERIRLAKSHGSRAPPDRVKGHHSSV